MGWQEKTSWLKRNPVTVARQINHSLQKVLGPNVLFSGMHPTGQIKTVKKNFRIVAMNIFIVRFTLLMRPKLMLMKTAR